MSYSVDFQIITNTDVPGISLVVAQNEDAFSYLTEEEDMAYFADGSVPLATDQVGDFISDAEWAHFVRARLSNYLPPIGGFFLVFFI